MPYPESSEVSPGNVGRVGQYNNLREDALYPIYQSFTYGETIAINDALYLKASDGKVYKTDADYSDERIHNFIGFAKEAGVLNDVKKVQIGGKVEGFTGLTIGSHYYLSGTAGAITITKPTRAKLIGIAKSATELVIFYSVDISLVKNYSVSDNLRNSNDASQSTSSTDYIKKKEVLINESLPACRIKFSLQNVSGNGQLITGRIYKNGVAIGTERTTTTSQEFTEDFANFVVNDLIQIYIKVGTGATEGRVYNMRFYYDYNITKIGIETLTTPLEVTEIPVFMTNQDPA